MSCTISVARAVSGARHGSRALPPVSYVSQVAEFFYFSAAGRENALRFDGMEKYQSHDDLVLGRICLALQKRNITVKVIAEVAGRTVAEVLHLIELAKADAAEKSQP